MKVKLEDQNEIWKKLEGQFYILAFILYNKDEGIKLLEMFFGNVA